MLPNKKGNNMDTQERNTFFKMVDMFVSISDSSYTYEKLFAVGQKVFLRNKYPKINFAFSSSFYHYNKDYVLSSENEVELAYELMTYSFGKIILNLIDTSLTSIYNAETIFKKILLPEEDFIQILKDSLKLIIEGIQEKETYVQTTFFKKRDEFERKFIQYFCISHFYRKNEFSYNPIKIYREVCKELDIKFKLFTRIKEVFDEHLKTIKDGIRTEFFSNTESREKFNQVMHLLLVFTDLALDISKSEKTIDVLYDLNYYVLTNLECNGICFWNEIFGGLTTKADKTRQKLHSAENHKTNSFNYSLREQYRKLSSETIEIFSQAVARSWNETDVKKVKNLIIFVDKHIWRNNESITKIWFFVKNNSSIKKSLKAFITQRDLNKMLGNGGGFI